MELTDLIDIRSRYDNGGCSLDDVFFFITGETFRMSESFYKDLKAWFGVRVAEYNLNSKDKGTVDYYIFEIKENKSSYAYTVYRYEDASLLFSRKFTFRFDIR